MPISRAATWGCPKRPYVALPGARFELDAKSGRYRIAKIFAGQNEEERYRSPLTGSGRGCPRGRLRARDQWARTQGRHRPLRVAAGGAEPAGRMARVCQRPTARARAPSAISRSAANTHLLYLAWVADNRARVDRMSRGRLGYIHIPGHG